MSQLSSQARRVVEIARRADDPSAADQRRILHALASRLSAGTTAALVGAGTAKAAAGATAMAVGKGVALVSVSVVLALALGQPPQATFGSTSDGKSFHSEAAPPTVAAATARNPSNLESRQPSTASIDLLPDSDVKAINPGNNSHFPMAAANVNSSQATATGPGNTSADPLQAETSALRQAQLAMREGNPASAVALINAQDIAFRSGALGQERAAARIYALCALGSVAEARRQSRQFAQRWPRSPMLGRVRAACDAP